MNIIRAQDTAGLADIRMAYLLEDFPEMSAEQAEYIRGKLPKYYESHLNNDFYAYAHNVPKALKPAKNKLI